MQWNNKFQVAGLAFAFLLGQGVLASHTLAEDLQIRFAHFTGAGTPAAKIYDDVVARVEAAHPGVHFVQEVTTHDEYLTQFKIGTASGSLADVLIINTSDLPATASADLLSNLAPDLAADPTWSGPFVKSVMGEGITAKGTFAVPSQQIVTHVIFYNKDLFAKAGINVFPTTWASFEDAIGKLKASGVIPIALGNKAAWVVSDPLFGTMMYRVAGKEWYERLQRREAKFTDPEFVTAVATFKRLVDIGAFNDDANSIDNTQGQQLYFTGKAAMFIEGNWAIGGVTHDARPEVSAATDMATWPAIPGGKGDPKEVTGGAGWLWAMNAGLEGEKRSAALDLIKGLTSVDTALQQLALGDMVPVNIPDLNSIKTLPLLKTLSERVASGKLEIVPIFPLALPPSILDLLGRDMQDLMVGRKTAEQVGADLQAEYERSQ